MGKIGDSLSHSKLPNILAGLIIFFSATQLGLHFWPASSLVYGIRIDYLSPTLYFLDTIIIVFLLLRRLFDRRPEQSSSRDAEGGRSLLIGIVPIILVNLLYSHNPLATLSWSLHLILYIVFLRTVLERNSRLQVEKVSAAAERTALYEILRPALTLTLLFQTTLALAQVYLGRSVGGLMYYLGERSVAVGSPNIALATFMDTVVLRAYGTFSHPNILAGWAVITLLIILRLRAPATKGSDLKGGEGQTLWVPLVLATLLILLTQSRAAALALFGITIPFHIIKSSKMRFLYYFITILLIFSLTPSFLTPPRSDPSVSERHTLQGLSLSVISSFPIFGTGAQSSISTYPLVAPSHRLLQPDHNSFTLFLSWFGVISVLALINFIRVYSFTDLRIYSFFPLLPLLLLDHYLLTSSQGLFTFILYVLTIRLSDNPAI